MRKVKIFGQNYTIQEQTEDQNPKLKECTGLVDLFAKKISIKKGYEEDLDSSDNVGMYKQKVLRHEVFHAIFHENGLSAYCDDETLIDFLAIQYPKIEKIMKSIEGVFK